MEFVEIVAKHPTSLSFSELDPLFDFDVSHEIWRGTNIFIYTMHYNEITR